jgi:uncharacterized damage-inducible protein DinB
MSDAAQEFITKARSYLSEDFLPKIERCLEQLNDDEVWWRANPESNSIGNLLLHLAGNVKQWIVSGVGGAADARVRQLEFDQRDVVPRAELLGRLRQTLSEADEALAGLDPARVLEPRRIQGSDVTVLEAVFHVVEHFSMHTGQIILQTKLLKGADLNFYDFSGGDPVPAWKAGE